MFNSNRYDIFTPPPMGTGTWSVGLGERWYAIFIEFEFFRFNLYGPMAGNQQISFYLDFNLFFNSLYSSTMYEGYSHIHIAANRPQIISYNYRRSSINHLHLTIHPHYLPRTTTHHPADKKAPHSTAHKLCCNSHIRIKTSNQTPTSTAHLDTFFQHQKQWK